MSKVKSARPNDFFYDPIFTVSGERDYYKAGLAAKISTAKFAICPFFATMFSDTASYPRQMFVMRDTTCVPDFKEQPVQSEIPHKPLDVDGADRYKFFVKPVSVPKKEPPKSVHYPLVLQDSPKKSRRKVNKMVQTQYRESSAQTIPWQPDYVVSEGCDPVLLMMDFLKWGSGLPCGMEEARLLERARKKKTWSKSLPLLTDAKSVDKRNRLLEAMARDEWAFREKEIDELNELRIQLLVEMINEVHAKSKIRSEEKIKSLCKAKMVEKEHKLKSLRKYADRELRKLELKRLGVKRSYAPADVIEEHANVTSELYAPLMRHGENPKRWHQVIEDHSELYKSQFMGAEEISTLPNWLDEATTIKRSSIKLPGTQLCIRETKWTEPVLKQLHEELKHLRVKKKRQCTLMVEVGREILTADTPKVEEIDEHEEKMNEAIVMIESFLRGRASQVLIYEGRNRCRELIHELRSTHALQENEKEKLFNKRLEVKSQQREYALCTKDAVKIKESLSKLGGNIVGTLLDFLNKELRRLIDERKIHAMCLMFERERNLREAAESGRRQLELRRQLEHDEMFKQIAKVNQDTVELYLEDIIKEGMEFASEAEAACYVKKLAKSVDETTYVDADNAKLRQSYFDQQELVSDMVHNFLLPEVEKQMLREKIKKKQKVILKTVHDTIYDNYEQLPKAEPKPTRRERAEMQRKDQLERAVCVNTFADLSTTDTHIGTDSTIESRVNIIFSATKVGFQDYDVLSSMHPDMEPLLNKQDTVSTLTSESTAIALKGVSTKFEIKTLEMPVGISDEILLINLNPKSNLL
ncbi:hypothetical protein FQR65_LT01297 [Abscondita terminalis]|nr:hypothetical protein FQR65_LT01297 [Abscondita terminalis]